MSTKRLCSRSHRVTTWGPSQESHRGAEYWHGAVPAFPGKGDWVRDGDLSSKGGGQIFIFINIYIYNYLVFSGSVKQSIGLHQFLQQIVQGKNHSYLLLPSSSLCRERALHGNSKAGTTGYHHRLCPWQRPGKGLHFQVFLRTSRDKACFVRSLCQLVTLLPVSQSP